MGAFIPEAAIALMGRDMASEIGLLFKDAAIVMTDVVATAQASKAGTQDGNRFTHGLSKNLAINFGDEAHNFSLSIG